MKKSLFILLSAIIGLGLNFGITIAEDITLSTSRSTPSTNQFVNLTIETDDDYTGKLTFSAKYRSSSSSNWVSISNLLSTTYFSDYSNVWKNGYYKMTSSDDGEVTLKNLVKFKKKGYYRIYVKDTQGNQEFIQFSVKQNDSNSDLKISISPSNPDVNEWIKLTIKTDNYVGKIYFEKLQYKSNSSSSRSSISMKSSTYISDYSTQWSNGYYRMTSSDDGEVTLKNLVKFKKKGYYRIYLKGDEGNSNYLEFNVGIDSDEEEDDEDDESNVSGFSNSELSKLKQTYKTWNSMIAQLKRKYPFLKKSISRNTLSNNFYDDMKDVVNNKKVRDFDDYDDFKKAFDDWYEYTMRNI